MKKIISTILILLLLMGNIATYAIDVEQIESDQEKPQAKARTYSYNNPTVPRGFTHKEGTWDTGFVIQDEAGNEFVWVPVDGTNVKYEIIDYLDDWYSIEYYYAEETVSEEELNSVEKFGGFYVGRYETGLEGIYTWLSDYMSVGSEDTKEYIKENTILPNTNKTTNTPLIQAGKFPWCFISHDNAKIVAENMYAENEVGGFTKLMNNHAWDTISAWINNTGVMTYDDLYLDSTNFGNYLNSEFEYINENGENAYKTSGTQVLMQTGLFMVNNISDLCGNMIEMTSLESTSLYSDDLVNVGRGGSFGDNGDICMWFPSEIPTGHTNINIGFRINLYLTEEPPIPEGFTYVEGTEKTGFTIQDVDGNQFVWIPVDGTTVKLEQKDWGIGDLNLTNVSDPTYAGLTTSVTEYGGFYIAKYEASDLGISQADGIPVTNISYTDAYNKCNEYTPSTAVQSHLVYGVEWDAMLQFMNTQTANFSISTTSGNYTGELANTGATTTDIATGICDTAGNVREWTQEVSNTNYKVFRGGYYKHSFAAGYRNSDIPETQDKYIGYRVALYVK